MPEKAERKGDKMNEKMKVIYDNLTDEQKAKAKACKTMDELMAFAGQEGIELPDEVLGSVSAGCDWTCYQMEGIS